VINFGKITKNIINQLPHSLKKNAGSVLDTNKSVIYEKGIPPQELIANYYMPPLQTEEIAPFAQRLALPDVFGKQLPAAKLGNIIKSTEKSFDNIETPEIKTAFHKLYKRVLNDTTNIEGISPALPVLSQKVEMIKNPKIKKEILDEFDYLSECPKKEFKNEFTSTMEYIESLADAVNVMNNKYSNVKNEPREFKRWLDNKNSWFADVIDGKTGTPDSFRNKEALSGNTISYEEYKAGQNKYSSKKIPQTYKNNLKFESFRRFIYRFGNDNPDITKELYLNEYLPKINPEIAKALKGIQKEYGTMVIASNANLKPADVQYVKEELRLWKEAGNGKEILPKVIDVNMLDSTLNKTNSSGIPLIFSEKIKVKELLDNAENCGSTLRHEITHINDNYEKIQFDDCTKTYNIAKWQIYKSRNSKQWKRELKSAGIKDENLREYAVSDRGELKAVSSECDMSKLSNDYKNTLADEFYMPRWIFSLPQNKFQINRKSGKRKIN